VKPNELRGKLKNLSDDCQVKIVDMTGTENHYEAQITSNIFVGKNILEQHRIVYDYLANELNSGEIHALSLKTFSS